MKVNLLILGTKNFNNSLDEVKENLGFSFTYLNVEKISEISTFSVNAIIIDGQIYNNVNVLNFIKKISNKPVLVLENKNLSIKCLHEKVTLPVTLLDLKSKIINLITTYKFNENSSIKINDYTLDKNEKKLKKNNLFIVITEREIQLIQLLLDEKKPLSKNVILKRVWNYAEDADTHTVETHIYRLRKKILKKFNDENFIINLKEGYSV
jgi:DNA-binding response OmpR family regulator